MSRIGLRAQLMISLAAAFLGSFALLALASIRLTTRARVVDRMNAVALTTETLALGIDQAFAAHDGDAAQRIARAALEPGLIAGIRVTHPHAGFAVGRVGHGPALHAALAGSGGTGNVTVWLDVANDEASTPLTNLLWLYAALTGAGILLLTYVTLTNLIVRPVESITRASERIARGGTNVAVRSRGAAEIARLADAFNDMASQLRAERAALEARLRDLERTTTELRTAQEGLVRTEKLASVGRLAAGIAHEIGNPLAAILGLIELLRDGGLDEREQAEFLRRIHDETERIHKIIRDLLDFARQSPVEQEGESSDLREVVEDAVRLIAPQKDLRGVSIERRLEDVPRVRGASHRLSQVVLNLLLNAADAIGGEGMILIEVKRAPDDKHVVLAVTDSGPGIAPEVLGSIFEPFVTTKPAGEGTGLGLAVSHTIVQALQGTLVGSNPKSGGARFEVTLPIA